MSDIKTINKFLENGMVPYELDYSQDSYISDKFRNEIQSIPHFDKVIEKLLENLKECGITPEVELKERMQSKQIQDVEKDSQ